jgi:GNAT superfamily N-acetyltransferase
VEIRPLIPADLDLLGDIDSTVESTRYLHVEQTGSGVGRGWRVEERSLRERRIASLPLDEETLFTARQLASGADDGVAIVADYESQLIGLLLAQPDPVRKVLRLLDVRVDFDFRRQGVGTGLAYMALQVARDGEMRAVCAETLSDNVVAAAFLGKLGFGLAGVDTLRHSNHDLVKERASLLWYHTLNEVTP